MVRVDRGKIEDLFTNEIQKTPSALTNYDAGNRNDVDANLLPRFTCHSPAIMADSGNASPKMLRSNAASYRYLHEPTIPVE